MMSRRIAPIFLPNLGCPHRCIFCNERITAGKNSSLISREEIERIVAFYIGNHSDKRERQIAFYGGNFTGIDPGRQELLLRTAGELVNSGLADSIRISTRPDYIDEKKLNALQRFPVRTVEVGVQSMADSVLKRSRRGHSAADNRRAINLLKAYGFETGAHLMLGLPGDDRDGLESTLDQIISLKPDMVRVHPTIVLEGTELAAMYRSGTYRPLDLAEAVEECRHALSRLRRAGIPVIRIGLQATPEMNEAGAVLAGPFHPALRSLVEGSIFLEMAEGLLGDSGYRIGTDPSPSFFVSDRDMSDFRGIGNRNTAALKKRFGADFPVIPDLGLNRGEIILEIGGKRFYKTVSDSTRCGTEGPPAAPRLHGKEKAGAH